MSNTTLPSQLEALRQRGACQQDPVGFFHIENLVQRADNQPEAVRLQLQAKAKELIRTFDQGTGTGVVNIRRSPLRELVQEMHRRDALTAQQRPQGDADPHQDLKSVRDFRGTWSKLSVDRKIKASLQQAPHNAGPINSHMVALRSMEWMREMDPDYLSRFVPYVDALICLENQTANGKGGRSI